MFEQNRRFKISFLMLFFCLSNVFSQQQLFKFKNTDSDLENFVRCATVESEKKISEEFTNRESEVDFENWMTNKIVETKSVMKSGRVAAEVYTIPVVIHIVHNGDPVNTVGSIYGENISDAQAISQIEVLNQDFGMLKGTPGGANSRGVAVDTEIRFELAKQTPEGFETTGIVRHNIEPFTDDVRNDDNFPDNVEGDWETLDDVQKLKNQTQWDPTKYFNIWTIRMGGESIEDDGLDELLGYAQFPSNSNLEGLNISGGIASTDGVVLSYHAFGDFNQTDGSFIMNNVYNEGRTATHEVGHWLGLRHIWGDTDSCDNDDYCEDTPDATHEHVDCNSSDTCTIDGLGDDMIENYMDYTPDTCMDTFTQDQKERMLTVLNNSPRRVELLDSPVLSAPRYSSEQMINFVVDPNPVTDTFDIVGLTDGEVNLSIHDTTGKVVYSSFYTDVDVVFDEEINVEYLPSGVYFLLLQNNSLNVVKKIIKN